jgi:signal transduction histidine kinase/ligand-binding sensor domain-containing protein/DNA-binding NarL/FixJ family response regulator
MSSEAAGSLATRLPDARATWRRHASRYVLAIVASLLLLPGIGVEANAAPERLAHEMHFNRLSLKQGLSQTTVGAIAQDSRGFMWFGTHDGLNRYDGYTFVSYRNDPGDASVPRGHIILSLLADPSGVLWVGTEAGGLGRFDPVTEKFVSYRVEPDNPNSLRSNTVRSIWRDEDGSLWLGTTGGWLTHFEPSSGTFRNYRIPQAGDAPTRGLIASVYRDRNGTLWLGHGDSGLARFDEASGQFTAFLHSPEDPQSIGAGIVQCIVEDNGGNLWVCTGEGGLNRMDRATGRFTRFQHDPEVATSISHDNCSQIFQDSSGNYWVATEGGLDQFDPVTAAFTRHHEDPSDPYALSDSFILRVFEDRSGVLWFGTHGDGVNRLDPGTFQFTHYRHHADNPNTLSTSYVYTLHEDMDGILWIGGDDGVLNRVDRAKGIVTHYRPDANDPRALNVSQSISAIHEARDGTLWIGTYSGGLHGFDRQTGVFSRYVQDPNDGDSLPSNFVLAVEEDDAGGLWVGTVDEGLSRFDPATGRFERIAASAGDKDQHIPIIVRDIHRDSTGTLWLTSWEEGLTRFDPRTRSSKNYRHSVADPNSLADDVTFMVHEDRAGMLWVATGSGLDLFDPRTEQFTHYSVKDGLPNNVIYAIVEDDSGALWFSSNNGISRLDPKTGGIRNYSEADGLQGEEFNQLAVLRCRDGKIMFGGVNGITAFDAGNVRDNPYVPPVLLTDFQLFTRSVPFGRDSILQKPIWATEHITLQPDQNVISLGFSALSYAAPQDNRYRYKLDGLDRDWYEVDATRRLATYTSLPPGNYVFRVQGSNDDGIWNSEGASLSITVIPPWWRAAWFRTLVAVTTVGLIAMAFAVQRRNARQRERLLEEVVEERTHELRLAKERAEAATRTKSAFLAHMSHELRTPLNAILGYTQILGRTRQNEGQIRAGLQTIQNAGEHLLDLINNILDLARIEAGKIDLEKTVVNVREFLDQVCDLVRLKAKEKGLTFVEDFASVASVSVYTDEGRLRQILLNLLGNAIKFTHQGSVTLRVESLHSDGTVQLHFEVVDTGIGIARDKLATIFEPFEQAEGVGLRHGGSGLGLAISAQLVNQLGSVIRVDSSPGQGSRFWFDVSFVRAPGAGLKKAQQSSALPLGYAGPRRLALVVDDVQTNRDFMMSLLAPIGFDVIEAGDGQEAIVMATERRPDVILLDMIMPVMDGLETCRELRRIDITRQTPIIALSANSSSVNEAAALEAGANAFLSKPFKVETLILLVGDLMDLQWCFPQADAEAQTEPPTASSTVVLPPLDQLERLLEVANCGNMRDIKTQAALLVQQDERYRPFAGQVQRLADDFLSIEVVELVRKAIERVKAGQG